MNPERSGTNPENLVEDKRIQLVFAADLLAAVDSHAAIQGASRTTLLRSFIKLKGNVDTLIAEAARQGAETTLKASDEVIDTNRLLAEYGTSDVEDGRFTLVLPQSEYLNVQTWAYMSGQNVTTYIRTAAALGIKIENIVWKSEVSKFRGYPISVGNQKLVVIL